jgi:SMI1/KNR4 family protein SUKH-1
MWMDMIAQVEVECRFRGGASDAEIQDAEQAVAVSFPDSLKELLRETDGVQGPDGLGVVWPVRRIAQDNLALRTDPRLSAFMPVDHLLFFADAGNGDLFAFPVSKGRRIERDRVFAFDHEDDSRRLVAWNLEDYLVRWLSGSLAV